MQTFMKFIDFGDLLTFLIVPRAPGFLLVELVFPNEVH